MNFKTFAASFAADYDTRAKHYAERAVALESRFNETQHDDDKSAMQRAQCYAQSFAKLASLNEAQQKILFSLKLDAAKIDSARDIRETVKRLTFILSALESQQRVKDRALDAMLVFVAAKKLDTVTNVAVMREMQHDTTRQSDAALNVFEALNCAKLSSKENKIKTFALDVSSDNLLSRLLKLYA